MDLTTAADIMSLAKILCPWVTTSGASTPRDVGVRSTHRIHRIAMMSDFGKWLEHGDQGCKQRFELWVFITH